MTPCAYGCTPLAVALDLASLGVSLGWSQQHPAPTVIAKENLTMTKMSQLSSGVGLGALVDGLRLRACMLNEVKATTLDRVVDGTHVRGEQFRAVVTSFVRALWTEYAPLASPAPSDDDVALAVRIVLHVCRSWDTIVARVGAASGRGTDVEELAVPFLRLGAVDAGIRAGAAVYLGVLDPKELDRLALASRDDVLRKIVEEVQAKNGDVRSGAALAAAVKVTANSFSSWMTGATWPEPDRLIALAKALEPKDWDALSRRMQFAAAAGRIMKRLGQLTSPATAADLLEGLYQTAILTHKAIGCLFEEKRQRIAIELLTTQKPQTRACAELLDIMATRVPGYVWALDVQAVRGDWPLRLSWWAFILSNGSALVDREQLIRFFPSAPVIVDADSADKLLAKMDGPARLRILGAQLLSSGLYGEAEATFREALRVDSSDKFVHYNLAIAIARGPGIDALRRREAIAACETALRIDPAYHEAALERGLLLIDARDFVAAEAQLLSACELGADEASVSYHLGYLCDESGRLEEALAHYRAALDENPAYVDAAVNGAHLAKRLGRKRDENWFSEHAAAFASPVRIDAAE